MWKTEIPVTVDALYNGYNISTALFADRVYLTDQGVSLYSKIIADKIAELKIH